MGGQNHGICVQCLVQFGLLLAAFEYTMIDHAGAGHFNGFFSKVKNSWPGPSEQYPAKQCNFNKVQVPIPSGCYSGLNIN